MSKTYRLTRDVSQSDCEWLDFDLKAGDIVFSYEGNTYGCISPAGKAFYKRMLCRINQKDVIRNSPFFELPRDAVERVTQQGFTGNEQRS